MKKIICIFLSLILCVSLVNINCFAISLESSENSLQDCTLIATSYISDSDVNYCLDSISNLYNTDNDLVAYCFNYKPYGYVIVTINDYIPQVIARKSSTPFPPISSKASYNYVYGGAMNFWTLDKQGVLTDIITEKKCDVAKVSVPYNVPIDNQMKSKILKSAKPYSNLQSRASVNSIVSGYLNGSTRTWANGSYVCGVNAASIVIMYLSDYRGLTLPNSTCSLNGMLQRYLIDNKYLSNSESGHTGSQIVNGSFLHISYKGINSFFNDNNYYVQGNAKSFSSNAVTELISCINNDYPAIIGSTANNEFNNPFYNEHWFVVYGYKKYDLFTNVIVNDGQGHDEVELGAFSRNFDSIILFS